MNEKSKEKFIALLGEKDAKVNNILACKNIEKGKEIQEDDFTIEIDPIKERSINDNNNYINENIIIRKGNKICGNKELSHLNNNINNIKYKEKNCKYI